MDDTTSMIVYDFMVITMSDVMSSIMDVCMSMVVVMINNK